MALSMCTVSGTLLTVNNTAIQGATVKATMTKPIVYGDGTFIPCTEMITTTAVDGTWSLALVETVSTNTTMTISIEYPSGGSDYRRVSYPVVIPNTATATFASLIAGQ